jgi:hypothetical protein
MEYLLEVRWKDPVANAVARILGSLPTGVEQTTGSVPYHMARAFSVLRVEGTRDVADVTEALAAAGAEVRVASSLAA